MCILTVLNHPRQLGTSISIHNPYNRICRLTLASITFSAFDPAIMFLYHLDSAAASSSSSSFSSSFPFHSHGPASLFLPVEDHINPPLGLPEHSPYTSF